MFSRASHGDYFCFMQATASPIIFIFIIIIFAKGWQELCSCFPTNSAEEVESLLSQDDSPNRRDRENHIAGHISVLKALTICVLLATIGEFCVRMFDFLNNGTSAFLLVASALICISWCMFTCFLFVSSNTKMIRETPINKVTLWLLLNAVVEILALVFYSIAPTEEMSSLDWCFLSLMFARLIPTLLLVIIFSKIRPPLQELNHPEQINSWTDSISKVAKLVPFLWPKNKSLKIVAFFCFLLLFLGRVVNFLVPYFYKILVDDLTASAGNPTKTHPFAWVSILSYTFFRFLSGNVGIISSLQSFLWIPVSQYTTREICIRMMQHLHQLSLKFHVNSKTGELLRIMDRGTSSIGSLLSYITFNIVPVFIDIGVAVFYFFFAFDALIAFIVFSTMFLYIFFTILITEWRAKFRRDMNNSEAASRGRAVDSLMNFETVKYFGNEEFELEEYDKAIRIYQAADFKSLASLNFLNTSQNLVITIGLLAGLIICAKRIQEDKLTIGGFVAFISYLLQLYGPLNFFGTYYRVIQQNFIDMEKLLELFEKDQAIKDHPDAGSLVMQQGGVKFENVSFTYDRVQVLKNMSFEVPPGKTYALVGPSGGGKSTCLKLLFRFYDVDEGIISIDGQDIRSVTQESLRKHIGVVPQETVLFNDTIRYNIAYGKIGSTQEEIERSAIEAQIHERILSFPDGYDTIVGERGLRLSGGEKQRVAMARTLLKNPSIILLDEATSSLDNISEAKVQNTLDTIFATRTRIVVAHRLSTIVNADKILVIKDGAIVESGTHQELLNLKGNYKMIWEREIEEK